MTARTQRALQALILAGLGLFLLQRLWTGTLYWYINERFFFLVFGAALGFLILARTVLPPGRGSGLSGGTDNEPDAHDHRHSHTHSVPAWRLWLVALPLILGLLVPARPLGSSALANRGINVSLPPATDGAASGASVPPTERTVLDWVRALDTAHDPGSVVGQPADVIGFVYHDSSLPEGEFMLGRFAVTCCAADASGAGVRVRWPAAAELESDTWVRVRGLVQDGNYAGRPIPIITAESIEGIDPPPQPYLSP